MKHILTSNENQLFSPLLNTTAVQAAVMVLQPGESSSESIADEHPASEQWLFVIDGFGVAVTHQQNVEIEPGSLILIETDEPHQIRNTGKSPLRTLNFYAPPAYTSTGQVRSTAKR